MTSTRSELAPESALPLAYFVVAHVSLATAFGILICQPELPGAFFFHPKMVALVHLLTVGWLTGSIFGALYIVAPLALRLPLPAGPRDWIAWVAFTLGAWGMVAHVWLARYDGFVWSALGVTAASMWLAQRIGRRLLAAVVPSPVKLHVALAFVNLLASVMFGLVIGWDRSRGLSGLSPMSMAFAHAHLAAIGWVLMMVVGLAYRLIPMFLPAAMPPRATLALSAVGIESGLVVVVVSLTVSSRVLPVGAVLIALGLVSFAAHIRSALRHRVRKPPALPRRDWSTWQTHTALVWLAVALVLGLWLTVREPGQITVRLMWVYGVAGLVGFLAQVVVGMQGRLIPLYAWYRACALRRGAPPAVPANALPSSSWARPIFLLWLAGVPVFTWGLAMTYPGGVRVGAGLLLAGVLTGGAYLHWLMRRAQQRRA